MKRWLAPLTGILVLLGWLPAPASAAAPIRLQATYTKGEQWTMTLREEDSTTFTAEVPQKTRETTVTTKEVTARWEVTEILPNGGARIAVRYEDLVGRVVKDGRLVDGVDTRQPQQPEAVRKVLAVMRKPFSVTVSRRAKIVEVAGLDEILDDWRSEAEQTFSQEKRAELDWLVESLLGSENVSKMLSEALTPLPAAPVEIGAEWSEPWDLRSEFMNMRGTRTYRLAPHGSLPEWLAVFEESRFVLTSNRKDLELETARATTTSTSTISRDSARLAWKRGVAQLDFELYRTAANRPRTLLSRSESTTTTTLSMRPVLAAQARAHLEQGKAFGGRREYDAAIREFDQGIALQPGAAELWTYRGIARHARGDLARALADLDRAIRLDPGLDMAYFSRAAVRVDLQDNAGAIADHTAVIQLQPEGWRSYFLRGILYSLAQQWPLAITDFTSAIERNPDVPQAYRFRADAYRRVGNQAAADSDQKKWLELGAGSQGGGAQR